jgi:hypothetical protein
MTLNIARRPEILEIMREAAFGIVLCGIETPDPEALHAMGKQQNTMVPNWRPDPLLAAGFGYFKNGTRLVECDRVLKRGPACYDPEMMTGS